MSKIKHHNMKCDLLSMTQSKNNNNNNNTKDGLKVHFLSEFHVVLKSMREISVKLD